MNDTLKALLANPLSAPITLASWQPENDQWLEHETSGDVVTYAKLVEIHLYQRQLIRALLAELKDTQS